MKRLFLILGLSLLSFNAHAAFDRYGNSRGEVNRSSYTEVIQTNVVIASSTERNGLDPSTMTFTVSPVIFLRSIIFSGVNAATATFYDAGALDPTTSTKTKVSYIPTMNGAGVTGVTSIPFDISFSSSMLLNLQCAAPCPTTITYDYSTIPPHDNFTKRQ